MIVPYCGITGGQETKHLQYQHNQETKNNDKTEAFLLKIDEQKQKHASEASKQCATERSCINSLAHATVQALFDKSSGRISSLWDARPDTA